MDEATSIIIDILESRRRVAVAMLEAYAADALGKPASPEDIASCEAEIAECDSELAELRGGQKS